MKYTHFVSHKNEEFGGERCDAYETIAIDVHDEVIANGKLADHSLVIRVMGHLLGKVLTTVEATTAQPKQAKAIKDLMRGHFSDEMMFVGGLLYDQSELAKLAEECLPEDESLITTATIDEMLGN